MVDQRGVRYAGLSEGAATRTTSRPTSLNYKLWRTNFNLDAPVKELTKDGIHASRTGDPRRIPYAIRPFFQGQNPGYNVEPSIQVHRSKAVSPEDLPGNLSIQLPEHSSKTAIPEKSDHVLRENAYTASTYSICSPAYDGDQYLKLHIETISVAPRVEWVHTSLRRIWRQFRPPGHSSIYWGRCFYRLEDPKFRGPARWLCGPAILAVNSRGPGCERLMYGCLAGYSPDPHDRVPKLGCHEGLCLRLRKSIHVLKHIYGGMAGRKHQQTLSRLNPDKSANPARRVATSVAWRAPSGGLRTEVKRGDGNFRDRQVTLKPSYPTRNFKAFYALPTIMDSMFRTFKAP
ncbi:hypothetical protein B0H17DRAFT_1130476 [Mycena rosella]|uniref:Uncharacterized protein n=1 Tax=Mycena rosella TaxID=1033263 RepID=A0AAD7GJ47_MYCRO|nr:hypothetical protein B0H17DRAFT_1130476 [Mycena rosella]